jgi:hypothetical protein
MCNEGSEGIEICLILLVVQLKTAEVAMMGRAIGIMSMMAAISYPLGQ